MCLVLIAGAYKIFSNNRQAQQREVTNRGSSRNVSHRDQQSSHTELTDLNIPVAVPINQAEVHIIVDGRRLS